MAGPLTDKQIEEIQTALFAGDKIAAIKAYRNATDRGLAQSKAFVESLEAELRQTSPERFAAPAASGCGAAVLAAAAVGLGIAWMTR